MSNDDENKILIREASIAVFYVVNVIYKPWEEETESL